jgi:PucR-like helix-turn-helix protein
VESTLQHGRTNPRTAPFPRELAGIMRPEMPSVADEIVAEIRAAFPEYAVPMDGPYGRFLREGVRKALTAFIDMVADPGAAHEDLAEVCRLLGQYEAREGRSLDSLQAAYRAGARIAWHRAMDLGRRANFSAEVMSMLADAAFDYLDELASHSQRGYLEERARSAEINHEMRRRLLAMILETPPASARAVAQLAEQAGWTVPEAVTMVAVQPGPGLADRAAERDLLADLSGPRPHLLVPGALAGPQPPSVTALLGGCRAAAGLTVPLASAADSLRWARKALVLAERGVIAGRFVRCDDHLLTLWLLADTALADQVARRELGGLAGLTPPRRRQLTDTLAAVLETRGTAAEVAEQLKIHPQTVRYRIRQLRRLLGDNFTNPDARFTMELAVRAQRLCESASRPQDGRGPVRHT